MNIEASLICLCRLVYLTSRLRWDEVRNERVVGKDTVKGWAEGVESERKARKDGSKGGRCGWMVD